MKLKIGTKTYYFNRQESSLLSGLGIYYTKNAKSLTLLLDNALAHSASKGNSSLFQKLTDAQKTLDKHDNFEVTYC